MPPIYPKHRPPGRRVAGFAAFGLLCAAALFQAGCPAAPPPPPKAALKPAPDATVRWKIDAVRRENLFIPLDMPVIISGTRISIGSALKIIPPEDAAPTLAAATQSAAANPAGLVAVPFDWPAEDLPALYSTHLLRTFSEGPLAEELTGQPRITADAGSYLVPLASASSALPPAKTPAANSTIAPAPPRTFTVKDPMPLYLHLSIPAGIDAGVYRFAVRLAVPGRAPEDVLLSVSVADLAVPTRPRVLAVATTTLAELSREFPTTFGNINADRLDRNDPDQVRAVAELAALVEAARQQGVALFVEDITPILRVDAVGQVTLDWDGYDRLMQPYMDGSAFEDHVPMPVWLAPVPPRRIRDSATQLWQYIDACARHFAAKGWVAAPAFLHPALADPQSADADAPDNGGTAQHAEHAAELRDLVGEMLRLHMPRDMLAVATPDATAEGVVQGELWTVNDGDPRLPPAGDLASESSLRAWPWVCLARDQNGETGPLKTGAVKGFVWRNALADARDLTGDPPPRPLLVWNNGTLVPTLRMAWLQEGLNDAALLGMLEEESNPLASENISSEILAGMIGRTGALPDPPAPPTGPPAPAGSSGASPPASSAVPQVLTPPPAPPGYLYAAWPGNRDAWSQVTPMLQKLILAGDPGTRSSIHPDDPDYLAAKIWLAQTRRPAGRVAGYVFSIRPGRDSDILDALLHLRIENPIQAAADLDLRFSDLPGDFDLPPEAAASQPPVPLPDASPLPAAAPVDDPRNAFDDPPSAASTEPSRRRSASLAPGAAGAITLALAGHVDSLSVPPPPSTLDITEHFAGASLRLPVQFPIYRMHPTDNPPKPDGNPDDWQSISPAGPGGAYGEMKIALHYLSRPDLSSGILHRDPNPATVRWTFDASNLYFLARCPQETISDQRNTDWPVQQTGDATQSGARWWGTDGLQIELSALPPSQYLTATPQTSAGSPAADPFNRFVKIAFKPAGIMLVQTGTLERDADGQTRLQWRDGPPAPGANIRYGISIQKKDGRTTGYIVEAAIPRAWIDPPKPAAFGTRAPAWRVNVLRHRASDLSSTSWAGPVVDDNDLAMMGALLGE